ncbi:hypothetical protein [Psychromicrobium xiongbiense]|uniref:hypothetical protein n=1 Tax=Psychromicrobium xiongbiense TaxID=3051184 RepID=UPI0025540418|nr:hypothetical protein [Psychromicrobium sp. YIM S02556]
MGHASFSGPTQQGILEVDDLLRETLNLPIDWQDKALGDLGRDVVAEMAARHPWLSPAALEALAWAYSHA